MEKMFYEFRPYLFLIIGAIGLHSRMSPLMLTSSVILVAAALHVCYSRAHHRGYFANVRIRS